MKKVRVVVSTLLLITSIFSVSCGVDNGNIAYNPKKEISKIGTIETSFEKDITKIEYNDYYYEEKNVEDGIEKYLSLFAYYSPKDESIVKDTDMVEVDLSVICDKDIIHEETFKISDGNKDWKQNYYKDFIGKKTDDVIMKVLTTTNEIDEYPNWIEENKSYILSFTITNILQKTIPELTNEDLNKYVIPNYTKVFDEEAQFTNVDGFREYIENECITQVDDKNQKSKREAILQYLEEMSENAIIDEKYAKTYGELVVRPYYENLAKLNNSDIDTYIKENYETTTDEQIESEARKQLSLDLVCLDIAKKLDIVITKEDETQYVEKFYEIYSNMNGTTIEQEKARFEKDKTAFYIMYLQEKVMQYLEENNYLNPNKILF